MKGTISKTVVSTTLEVERYNTESKKTESVIKKLQTLRKPSAERIENWLMEQDRGYIDFDVLSTTTEVYTMSADDFIKYATRKEK